MGSWNEKLKSVLGGCKINLFTLLWAIEWIINHNASKQMGSFNEKLKTVLGGCKINLFTLLRVIEWIINDNSIITVCRTISQYVKAAIFFLSKLPYYSDFYCKKCNFVLQFCTVLSTARPFLLDRYEQTTYQCNQ